MPSAREMMNALFGAYRLACFDAGGMRYFDTSIGGFWRSFFAAVLIAPFYAIFQWLRFRVDAPDVDPFRHTCVEVISYVIAWVLFPLVMVSLAKFLDREQHYLRYIVAYNWAAVLQNALIMPIGMVAILGGPEIGPADFLSLVALVAVLAYMWFVTRTALDIDGGTAATIVALDFILGLFLDVGSQALV